MVRVRFLLASFDLKPWASFLSGIAYHSDNPKAIHTLSIGVTVGENLIYQRSPLMQNDRIFQRVITVRRINGTLSQEIDEISRFDQVAITHD